MGYTCQDKASVIEGGGKVIENTDGSVSLFINNGNTTLTPIPMTKSCCQKLDPNYTFDIDTQKCIWGESVDGCEQPFKVVLNPKGNDGVIFSVDENNDENCSLDVSFDYLMQFDCEDITTRLIEAEEEVVGLTEFEISQLNDLQLQYQTCTEQRIAYDGVLINLQLELEATPYVIECITGFGGGFGTGTPVSGVSDNTTLVGNFGIIPFSFPTTASGTYCLTEAGLQEWLIILGTNTYNSWLNSNGTDTSLYGCDEVNELCTLDNNTGTLLGTCAVSITARQVLITQINETQSNIDGLDCDGILTQINELQPIIPCFTVSDMFETLNVCMTLDMVNPDTGKLETVYEESIFNIGSGNLPTYLEVNQPNTGLITTGATGTTFCENVAINLMTELQVALPQSGTTQIQDLVQNSLDSQWLNFETSITDQTILDMIYNEKIKVSLYVKNRCVDFAILIDRIKLDRNCSKIKSSSTTISKSPSFDMIRVCDNKKSWLSNEDFKHREFDLRFRDTQYDINNYKLAINSKEVDLDINPANAIEQDLFCYIQDNPCLLECSTGGTSTIEIDTNLDFAAILLAETISCDGSYTSGCSVTSQWEIDIILGCDTIYSNDSFYTSSGITDVPTQAMYVAELNNIATALDLTFTTGATSVTFTYMIDCDEIKFLDKTFDVSLGLDITTTCSKNFQDGENFLFQDEEDYDFN